MVASEYGRAIEVMNRAAERGVDFRNLHTQLAQAHYRNGDTDAALREIRLAVEENPRLASPHAVLAGLLAETGEYQEARAEYREALSLTQDPRLRARLEDELRALEGLR